MNEYIFNHISGQITILADDKNQAYQKFDDFLRDFSQQNQNPKVIETMESSIKTKGKITLTPEVISPDSQNTSNLQ